jgi:hypothetical protein
MGSDRVAMTFRVHHRPCRIQICWIDEETSGLVDAAVRRRIRVLV